jgi:imidazolonepropionase-like amidohydrolase
MFGKTLHPRRLFDAGRLALGPDSRLTGSFDLLHELKAAARESDLTPAELLRLVTVFAARVLRRPDVGGLAPSQRADLVVIPDPGGDPYSALLATDRAGLAAVVREGTPAVAEPHLARLFELAGITPRSARLDGRPKLVGPALLSVRESVDLEQGLVPS